MTREDQVEKVISVRGEACPVVAVLVKGRWKASGTHRGKLVEVFRASTPVQAFEWWTNKAGMQAMK
jgi:TusA-related sulfurtransferase